MIRSVASGAPLALAATGLAAGCLQSVQILESKDTGPAPKDAGTADVPEPGPASRVGGPFGPPRFLFEAMDVSLPDSELELFCIVDDDLMVSRRASLGEPWGSLVPIFELNSPAIETDPTLVGDGLTITFTSYRDGGDGDIFVATRPSATTRWSIPTRIPELSSPRGDCCAVYGAGATVALFASFRTGDAEIFRTERANSGAPWGEPSRLSEFGVPGTDDLPAQWRGDLLVMDSDRAGTGRDIYVVTYPAGASGSVLEPLASVNGPNNDRDGWLSVDGRRLYFQSDREGPERIYLADRPR